ncbi:hypothetical protein CRE_18163 [Caenorhabditis remanei]|uniref:Uncharacterized protein n=1 Tax=Caenorhabditis remanei TaxID=31234 RepID=E3N8K4_CAERE|nr:hypothetical protein CRE_18163 [Caenorhabditis remanei]
MRLEAALEKLEKRVEEKKSGLCSEVPTQRKSNNPTAYQCNQSSNQITQVVIIPEKVLKRRSDNAEGLMQIDKDGMDGKIKRTTPSSTPRIDISPTKEKWQSSPIRELGEYVYEGIPEKSKELLLASHFLTGCNKKINSRLRQLQNIPKSVSTMKAEADKVKKTMLEGTGSTR